MFTFVHLSDIHFSRSSSDYYDLDGDLREQFANDLQGLCEKLKIAVDAILVTGDIAYSGQRHEYEIVGAWLDELSGRLDCSAEQVWVTPGNHDVDRSVASCSPGLQQFHHRVRNVSPSELSQLIASYCRDGALGPGLFKPLEEYCNFAQRFGCRITNSRPYWIQEELTALECGTVVRLQGVNSVLVSSAEDKEREGDAPGNLVLGEFQVPRRKIGTVCISLCHHPMSWVRDEKVVRPFLDRRAVIQLYGHTHEFEANSGGEALKLNAGALQPDRNEAGWQPRYNLVRLGSEDGKLTVRVYPRMWNNHDHEFRSAATGDADFDDYVLPLKPPETTAQLTGTVDSSHDEAFEVAAVDPISEDADMRLLLYRYMGLSYHERIRIAQALELIEDQDENLIDSDKFGRVLTRVKERGVVDKFLRAIQESEKNFG